MNWKIKIYAKEILKPKLYYEKRRFMGNMGPHESPLRR
jgi:hypothetical protein